MMCVRIQPCVMAESFFSLSVVLTANYYLATKRGQLAGRWRAGPVSPLGKCQLFVIETRVLFPT
jgi:hypothetical protein